MEDEIRPKALMVPFDKFVVLDLLPPEQYKTVFSGMRWYVEQGREPEDLVPLEKMAFETLRPFLDENIKTYQRKVQTQRENGARGGRPRKPSETHGFSAKPNETHKNQSTKVKVQSTKDKVQSSSRENDCVLTTTTEKILWMLDVWGSKSCCKTKTSAYLYTLRFFWWAWVDYASRTAKNSPLGCFCAVVAAVAAAVRIHPWIRFIKF